MKAFATLLGLGLVSALSAQSPLTTIFAGPNGGAVGGVVYVNMTANVDITINRIDINTAAAAGTQGRVRVWQTVPGFPLFSGSETIAANWQVIGEGHVIAAGQDLPSVVTFTNPITITAAMGQRGYAFQHIGIQARYTNGTGANQIYNTAELNLTAGAACNVVYADAGGDNPFFQGALFNPRVFNGAIHYVVGTSAPVLSFSERVARGCGDSADSFFDLMLTPELASPALTGRQVIMSLNGFGGYTVTQAGGAVLQPYASHTPLSGWATTIAGAAPLDDGEVTVAFPTGFPHPAGVATSFVVHNGGMVSLASNMTYLDSLGGDDWAPTVTGMLGAPNTAWYSWHDMDLTTSGDVRAFDNGSQLIITWVNVPSFGLAGSASTFQMVFDVGGTVTMAWELVHPVSVGNPLYSGNPWLVGYSVGGASARPEVESSIGLAATYDLVATASVSGSLRLTAEPRPTFGSTINYTASAFPLYPNGLAYGFPYGLLYFSVANPAAPGFPLAFVGIGRPNCLLNFDLPNAIGPFDVFAPGAALSINTNTVVPSMLGLDFWGQLAVVDVVGDLLGSLVTSNALHQRVQNN